MLSFFIKTKKVRKKGQILYLAAFYPENSGYHWRAKKWASEFEQNGFSITILNALNENEFKQLYKENFNLFLIQFLRRRFKQIIQSRKYETVIVQRELLIFNDYGNLFLEKFLLKIHPNAILDFDDDLSAAKNQPKEITNWFGKIMLENGDKFNSTLKMYKHFIVASAYLKNRVIEQNLNITPENICVIPTCVDYDEYPIKDYSTLKKNITLGWIGGDHNYYLLDLLLPILDKLSENYSFKLLVIGGSPYNRQTKFVSEFRKWNLNSEVQDLNSIDIGLMPLTDDAESRGKGGFKLIQYMGLGIVSIAAPITINKEIITHGYDSFLAMSGEEWESTLEKILKGEVDLIEMGKNARQKIERNYTFNAKKKKYIEFIERVRNSGNLV